MEKVYIVTLKNRDDLEDFYAEMSSKGFRLHMKRPISRNTNYYMTREQADELKKDSRVLDVELADNIIAKPTAIYNNTSYNKNGFFWKNDTITPVTFPSATDFQWGHIHAGSASQIGKGSFGTRSLGGSIERKNASVDVFNNGKHVDVIIVDEPMAYDSEEWYSPSTNTSRFVQYQWFNELNSFVTSIDDDGVTPPTGNVTYHQNSALSDSHGQHVGGTIAGQHYGWANEANIYSMAFLNPNFHSGQNVSGYLIYDYLRAFHLHKAVNPVTGRRNPTITNHSYGGIYYLNSEQEVLSFSKLNSVFYRGVTYNSGNPGPSGWSQAGVETDFGVRFLSKYPSHVTALIEDTKDAVEDGVIFIGSAGNSDLLIADPSSSDWNNTITFEYETGDIQTRHYNRGAWPTSPDSGAIIVGSLSNEHTFERSGFSMFGPGVDIFAPGERILSCYGNTGTNDTKYSAGSANYYAYASGTSMASPQVSGVVATLATAKPRFTNSDVKGYIQRHSKDDDMTFNSSGGSFNDDTSQHGSPNKYLISKNPRPTSGMIEDVKGERKSSGMTFPRRATLNYVA